MSLALKVLVFLAIIPVCALVFVPLELAFPIHRRATRPVRSLLLDYLFFCCAGVVGPLVMGLRTAVVGFALGMIVPWWSADQIMTGYGPIAMMPLWAVIPLLALCQDFMSYWIHRLLHSKWLWRFHRPHHSADAIDWAVLFRVHPMETVVMHTMRGGALLLVGFSAPQIVIYDASFFFLVGLLAHANVNIRIWNRAPLKYLLVGPMYHHWHHACEEQGLNKNMALVFPFWDLLFGTFYLPDRAPVEYGVREPMDRTFFGLLASPFVRARLPPPPPMSR
ncbi:sterol desaturase family protein [Pendulispora albinea]|uniref:Sterol desaturase family protein n=1 Tax=Pendulispora albinea TaxID=2741071 RepID=A0ABZ2LNS6_9BACT